MTKKKTTNVQQGAWEQAAPSDDGAEALGADAIQRKLEGLPGWDVEQGELVRSYRFDDFGTALAFANAVGWLAEAQNHHPDVGVSWGRCALRYRSHSADGITEKDFIAAARADQLYQQHADQPNA